MADEPTPVTREAIIRVLREALEPLPFVDAFWEGGAASFGRIDEWSDLDLYLVVADERLAEAFRAVEEALETLSPIARRYEPPWPPESGTRQAFYRLARASEHLLVDLAVFGRSARDKYLEVELHGPAQFYFNKGDAVRAPPLDADAFLRTMMERRARLVLRMELFAPFVTKELRRRNWLEALDAYRVIVLDPLVEILRMRHGPAHYAFKARYVHYELPAAVTERLEHLAFVGDPSELESKCHESVAWFRETAAAVNEADVRARLRTGPADRR